MSRILVFSLIAAGVALTGCGAKDRLAQLKRDYAGASQYLCWKNYVLIRYGVDDVMVDAQPAVLLRHEGKEWVELGRSDKGFESLHEVIGYIPEMDESGVAAFGLH